MTQEWNPIPGSEGWRMLSTEDRIRVLRKLYDDHDYSIVVRSCQLLLEKDPKNRSLKKLKRMAKMRALNSDMKIAMTTLTLALFVRLEP